jgi:hypothetical protein
LKAFDSTDHAQTIINFSKKNSLILKNNCDLNDLLLSNYSSSIMLKITILINQITKSTPIFSLINSMKHNRKIEIRGRLNDILERI